MDVAKLETFKAAIRDVAEQARGLFDQELATIEEKIRELTRTRDFMLQQRDAFLTELTGGNPNAEPAALADGDRVKVDMGTAIDHALAPMRRRNGNGHAAVRPGRIGRPVEPINEKVFRRLNTEFTLDDVRKAVSRYGSQRLAGVTIAQLSRSKKIKKTKTGYRKLQ